MSEGIWLRRRDSNPRSSGQQPLALPSEACRIYFYLDMIVEISGMGTTRWINNYVKQFPIPEIWKHDQLAFIRIANKILSITKDDDYLQNLRKQAQGKEYGRQIDRMVYELYGLTEEEIKTIED